MLYIHGRQPFVLPPSIEIETDPNGCRLVWTSCSLLGIPVQSELSALIFQKSLRMKDIKGIQQVDEIIKDVEDSESMLHRGNEEDVSKPNKQMPGESDGGHQDVVNLLGVDTQRVSSFVESSKEIFGSTVVMTIAVITLVNLIDWVSTIAGFLVPFLLIPLNSAISKGYVTSSTQIMNIRDQKSRVVAEALAGIRQIKFTAAEDRWEKRIGTIRERELAMQWRILKFAISIRTSWTSVPILLGMVSLGTYGWINGGASAAVTFTTLTIFRQIERSLGVIPLALTEGANALISCKRIQAHLHSQEIRQSKESGERIAFEDACISWPSQHLGSNQFVLQHLNLEFPAGELSVIYGETGSGKSLLLTAILQEVEIISGKVYTPKGQP